MSHRGGKWACVRVNDDGRVEVVQPDMKPSDAQQLAGVMRDRQSDDDVGEGWNVLAMGAADLKAKCAKVGYARGLPAQSFVR